MTLLYLRISIARTDLDDMGTVEELHFFYDVQSNPAFVKWNNAMYRYVHNLQGAIVGIVDAASDLVVECKYDVWGKPISTTRSMADTLGEYKYKLYNYSHECLKICIWRRKVSL